jgi:membrane-bound lytic murein transglycosylase MltF
MREPSRSSIALPEKLHGNIFRWTFKSVKTVAVASFFLSLTFLGFATGLAQDATTVPIEQRPGRISEEAHSQYAKYNEITEFDPFFKKYSKRYFGPHFDWRYFKAQAIAESNLEPDARSGTGAAGLMQIMPTTWESIKTRNPYILGGRQQARWNIAAAIWYDYDIWRRWSPKRTKQDRINFMMASYNAGLGSIMQAQRLARRKNLDYHTWQAIEDTLPDVTGQRSRETIRYVRRINRIKLALQ